jgi:multiple sugar transport system ATP-binding protein
MSTLELRGVSKSFGAAKVIHGVDVRVEDREFVVIVGPSGCGKSTLLRMIAGLEEVNGGDLLIDDKRVNDVPAAKRQIAMVFQSYALYPNMTARENLAFSLKLAKVPRQEIAEKVARTASILQIEELLDRRPGQMSGGQRQRVAIGRAIVRNPKIFLFDEPLSNLDAKLRVHTRFEISQLHKNLKATIIYVTHDQVEAMTMADKIVVMNNGRVEQVGSPLALYNSPANLFVAGFIGSPAMNFFAATGTAGGAVSLTGGGSLKLTGANAVLAPSVATVGIRPEHLTVAQSGASGTVDGLVTITEKLGSVTQAYVQRSSGPILVQLAGQWTIKEGSPIRLSLPEAAVHLFDANGNRLNGESIGGPAPHDITEIA